MPSTVNLAGILSILGKKVLIVDFDPQQTDLTSALRLQADSHSLFDVLKDKNKEISQTIYPLKGVN
ncbi:MAG: ParA family protein [Microcystaceae cyanobacterium]